MALTTIDDRGLKTPIDLLDNEKIRFGTGNDLEIYHNGSASFISDQGTGDLLLLSSQVQIVNPANSEAIAIFTENGSCQFYHDNTIAFKTLSGGGLDLYGNVVGGDNRIIKLGDGHDLQIYHDGTDSYLTSATGELRVYSNGGIFRIRAKANENAIIGAPDGEVQLYYDNSKKFETRSSGVEVFGDITCDGHYEATDDSEIRLGLHDDLKLYHSSGNNYIDAAAAQSLFIRTSQLQILGAGGGETLAKFNDDGNCELYYDNSKKLESTSTGITVIGDVQIGSGSDLSKELRFADSSRNDASSIKVDNGSNSDLLITNDRGSGSIRLATNSAERMRIDSSGRLLLGTTTPGSADADDITIAGSSNSGLSIRSGNTSSGLIYFADGTSGAEQYAGFIQYSHGSDNKMYFGAGAATRFQIESNGNVKVNDGNLVIGTAGHGIDFSANSHEGGMSSELLDSYEEGTFTPSFGRINGSHSGVGYGYRTGTYTKVGRLVTVRWDVNVTSNGNTGNGVCGIMGLPFTSLSGTSAGGYGAPCLRSTTVVDSDIKTANTSFVHESKIYLYKFTNGTGNEDPATANATGRCTGECTYYV